MPLPRIYRERDGRDEPSETARQVHVSEHDTWTGLYDASGRKLVRTKEPFGFVPRKDK